MGKSKSGGGTPDPTPGGGGGGGGGGKLSPAESAFAQQLEGIAAANGKVKLVVAGSRHYTNKSALFSKLDAMLKGVPKDQIEIVSGGAKGADRLAKQYAQERGLAHKEFAADWTAHGKSAGPRRNKQMAEYGDAAIGFRGGFEAKGTTNMLNQAASRGLATNAQD